jgi:hypothetical protein
LLNAQQTITAPLTTNQMIAASSLTSERKQSAAEAVQVGGAAGRGCELCKAIFTRYSQP